VAPGLHCCSAAGVQGPCSGAGRKGLPGQCSGGRWTDGSGWSINACLEAWASQIPGIVAPSLHCRPPCHSARRRSVHTSGQSMEGADLDLGDACRAGEAGAWNVVFHVSEEARRDVCHSHRYRCPSTQDMNSSKIPESPNFPVPFSGNFEVCVSCHSSFLTSFLGLHVRPLEWTTA
jgi:hypothetical protein